MTPCTEDHAAATGDYCHVCGIRLGGGPAERAHVPAPAPVENCASCGAARVGRFCEVCGHDSSLPAPPAPAPAPPAAPRLDGWTAVVRTDRAWFDEVRRRDGPDAAGLQFPRFWPERHFTLSGPQMTIGRRSRSRGIDPEIDLSDDPGVSAPHALLLARQDGGWELVDLDSTNGTTVGDAQELIAPNIPVPLHDGDVVKLGAWTTITLQAPRPASYASKVALLA